ncbi:anti-sigma-D factor RsdA [Longispora urticae]
MTPFEEFARTDALLDALGRGGPVPAGDPLVDALAAWRADVTADEDPSLRAGGSFGLTANSSLDPDAAIRLDDSVRDGAARLDLVAVESGDRARTGGSVESGDLGRSGGAGRPAGPGKPAGPGGIGGSPGVAVVRGGRSRRRLVLAAAAVVVLAAGGSGVAAAGNARPGSPLWPVTRVVYADRAASTLAETRAEESLNLATQALETGRPEDAQKYLAEAERWLDKVTSDQAGRRLRQRTEDLRGVAGGVEGVPGRADPRFAPTPRASKPVDNPGDKSRPTGGTGDSGDKPGGGPGAEGGKKDDGDKGGDDKDRGGHKGDRPPRNPPKPPRQNA